MVFECYHCEKCFDSDETPEVCPLCGSAEGFHRVIFYDDSDNEITFAEYAEGLLKDFLEHVPEGYTREEILKMTSNELYELSYFV